MRSTKVTILALAAAAPFALMAPALASPAFGRGMAPSSETTVSRQMLQVTPQNPDLFVGGQAMPAFGRSGALVTTNTVGLRDLHPGYRGFISGGR